MELKKLAEYKWELPQTGAMQVPGIIYDDHSMLTSPTSGS